MKKHRFPHCAMSICLGAMILSACTGQRLLGIPDSSAASTQTQAHSHTGSWMDPQTSSEDLLYISSYTNGNVYVYTYPQGELVGTLTGFVSLYGECTDAAGNVFVIADPNPSKVGSTIYEYAHGGTTPIATLSDPNGAFGCAVDPTTGNLAASGGGVAIYKHAAGKPNFYFSSTALYYCAYDDHGNLFVSGVNDQYGNLANLYVWRVGNDDLEQISLSTKLYRDSLEWPSVQWHEKYLEVSSNELQKPITIYRLRVSGSTATVIGSTALASRVNSYTGQTLIRGETAIGFGLFKRGYQNAFFWSYPKGGLPQRAIRKVAHMKQWLWGVAVSLAQSR